jgi:hypothetical protein
MADEHVTDQRPPDHRPGTLQRLQTELMVVRARRSDLQFKVRQRQLVETDALRESTIRRAHRVRDQLITAPARHAPQLAAEYALPMEQMHAALTVFMTSTLRWIAGRGYEPPTTEAPDAETDKVSQI